MESANELNAEPAIPAVIPQRLVRLLDERACLAIPRKGAAAEPQVELIRDGEAVRAIEVTCTCGKKIRLRCVYPQ